MSKNTSLEHPSTQICRHGIDLEVDNCSDCAVERDLADYDALQDRHADLKLRCERLELSLQRCKAQLNIAAATNPQLLETPDLLIAEQEAEDLLTTKLGDWYALGICHVDSGMLMICDPCYIKGSFDSEFSPFGSAADSPANDQPFGMAGCFVVTSTEEKGGQLLHRMGHPGAGVAFAPGYGDGTYEVQARKNADGRIAEVRILL